MIANFHEQDVLREVVNRKSGLNQINKNAHAQERDALIDIYNYAARFDTVPQIKAEILHKKERGRIRKYVAVSVELFEQGIKVTGIATEAKPAEVKAGILFKKEAENYHARRGSDAIVIKDSGALTTETASHFLEFYKILHPGSRIEIDTSTVTHPEGRRLMLRRSQLKINGAAVGEAVEMESKKRAEDTASLAACVALKKKKPDLYPRFLRALKSGNGQILKPVPPIDFNVDEDCSLVMRETLLAARREGLPDAINDLVHDTKAPEDTRGRYRREMSADVMERRNWSLQRKLSTYLQDPKLVDLRNKKADLPMNQNRARVLDLVNNNVYSIIVGATGSGKTTQVPQILLEEAIAQGQGAACNIICTQPRRIAATSVSRRVAVEKAEQLQESVGYHVRFDTKLPQLGGSITYCTTGILLQRLQHHPDEIMDCNSHLVIDEVHERDTQIDFLLILLRKSVTMRKSQGKSVPKIVLMSATMDTELFASYFKNDFDGEGAVDCPSLSVPGRAFPVRERYLDEIVAEMKAAGQSLRAQSIRSDAETHEYLELEAKFRQSNPTSSSTSSFKAETSVIDWKRERTISAEDGSASFQNEKENGLIPFGLIASTIAHIAKTSQDGAILVFLPGLAEITKVEETLMAHSGVNFRDASRYKVFLLHSSIGATQNDVFDPVPEGCRKIILATNIAETSVTIPDVQYVVDTGKLREKQYDQTRRISQLACTWISKSNAKQRAGRAGRVQNGNYYALYTKERYESLRAIGLPELLRVDLQETCLQIKAQAFKTPIREFLAEAIEPPSAKSVDTSLNNLEALDALTDEEEITPLGRLLASLPVHPSLGKMIVLGIIFRCLDPMLILGAASAERSLFLNPLGARAEAQEAKLSFVEGSASDQIALLNAIRELRGLRDEKGEYAMRNFAHQNFLHLNAFKTIDATAEQISDILVQAGLIPRTPVRERLRSQIGDPALNENSLKVSLIKALALAGFYPNLAVNLGGGRVFRTPGEKATIVHPSSVNTVREKHDVTQNKHGMLYSYATMARSNDGGTLWLRDTTESTCLMASLFGGKLRRHEERSSIIEMDNWLPFYVTSMDRRATKTVIEFRKALERLLAIAFKDLGQLSANNRTTTVSGQRGLTQDSERTFLADEKVREIFAGGLVEVLDRDVRVNEKTAERGWGAGNNAGAVGAGAWSKAGKWRGGGCGGIGLDGPGNGGGRGNGSGKGKTPSFYGDLIKQMKF